MAATSVGMRVIAHKPADATRAWTPVAASTATRPLVEGPLQPATVLGSPSGAIYLRTGGGELVAVVSPRAARLPMGAVAATPAALRNPPTPGQLGTVGSGRIEAGPLSARVVRWWDPRPALPPVHGGVLAANLALLTRRERQEVSGLPARVVHDTLPALGAALRAADEDAAVHAASALVGLGPGLTPAGDDVLVGLLSALACLGHPESAVFAARLLAAADGRTIDLSLALLRHAAIGNCIGAVGSVVRALAGAGELRSAHQRLLAVGHSSGAALLVGILLGADVTARR